MQSLDEVAPVLRVAFPSTQTVHAAAPRADHEPTGHATHAPDDASRYFPGSHCLQNPTAVAPVETVELPVTVALHRAQAVVSIPGVPEPYFPMGQGVQGTTVVPSVAPAYLPFGHAAQLAATAPLKKCQFSMLQIGNMQEKLPAKNVA